MKAPRTLPSCDHLPSGEFLGSFDFMFNDQFDAEDA